MSLSNKKTLILGGGLAGISTAFHLKNDNYLLIEKESYLGGTARSYSLAGFTFDFTGHLLHLHHPYTKKLISKLLKNNFYSCVRKSAIFSCGVYTKYPYQAYTNGLPEKIVDDCVLGFFEALNENASLKMNFKKWCLNLFGRGISIHFMIPYNAKLYQISPDLMTPEWCGTFVPKPKLEDVIHGALSEQELSFGYNTSFLYPKKGGIQVLAEKLGENLKNVSLNTLVETVYWKKKEISLSDKTIVHYENLVNTMPLVELLKRLSPLPPKIKEALKKLKFASVMCINMGIDRPHISDLSWIYFPEKKFPFYRIGFPMNFTPHVVPKNCSSMYVEVPMRYAKTKSKKGLLKEVQNALIEADILKQSDKILVAHFLPIKYAYVIYDKYRKKALNTVFSFLEKHSIKSIGRYGAWKYSFMEEAILDGKKAAESISNPK